MHTQTHTNTRTRCNETAVECHSSAGKQRKEKAQCQEIRVGWREGVGALIRSGVCWYSSVCERERERRMSKFELTLESTGRLAVLRVCVFFLFCFTNTHTPKTDMHDCQWYAISIPLFHTVDMPNGT